MTSLIEILRGLNQVFEAGMAITALSLFIRSLSFNLRDRVSRSFAIVLACVMFIFTGEAVGVAVINPAFVKIWIGMQWWNLVPAGGPAALFGFFVGNNRETISRPPKKINFTFVCVFFAAGHWNGGWFFPGVACDLRR